MNTVTRSLRLRFFLTTWPLIVVAVAGVALVFARWTDVRLTSRQIEGPDPVRAEMRQRADSIASRWAAGELTDAELGAQLRSIAARDSMAIVLIDAHGQVVVSSDPHLTVRSPTQSLPGPAPLPFIRTIDNGRTVAQLLVTVSGWRILDHTGTPRAVAYILPMAEAPPLGAGALRADARRTLWIAAGVASVLAALLSLLLARPLVAQVSRLADAATRVSAGDLAARLTVTSRDELGRLEQTFNDMASTLERAEVHKRNLMHDVAHELRTPLTNIVGMLEAIEDGLRTADDVTLATLRTEAGLLTSLVGELQELHLAEAGHLAFALDTVDVVAECAAAIDAMRDAPTGVTLIGPTSEAVFATADARRLRQVLRNVLKNALTYTPAGGQVRIDIETRGDEVGILVHDTGRGIPPEHLPLVWERFHRVDPSRDRAGGGRGLGLAIVKQFVEGMGGRVAVSSSEGHGSTFEIWLKMQALTTETIG